MGELIHTSHIRVYRDKPPYRRAYIEHFPDPVPYGVHGGIKHFYGKEPDKDVPATLDHMIAAIAG